MHPEALNVKGKEIFPKLKHFSDFYLAGGTALALQIGHRISVDFDLFSENDIQENLLKKAREIFARQEFEISVNNKEELTFFINGVKISFIKYPFPVLGDFVNYEGVKLLNLKELCATKAYTIGRRGSFKDYVDLYFAVSLKYAGLMEIIELAEKKYAGEFNSRLFLEQLIYLEDIEDTEILFLAESADKIKIEKFFKAEIQKLNLV